MSEWIEGTLSTQSNPATYRGARVRFTRENDRLIIEANVPNSGGVRVSVAWSEVWGVMTSLARDTFAEKAGGIVAGIVAEALRPNHPSGGK